MFEVQLLFTLVVLVAVTASLAFGAFFGWLLVERKNAPFRDRKDDSEMNDVDKDRRNDTN